MAIRLLLKNNNTEAVDMNIYRSDTEIDRANLPAPLITLSQVTGDPIVVPDPTAVQDKFYYYVFETIGKKDRQLSRNFYLQATETRGAGPSKILVGDANLGFMGFFPMDDLIGATDLITATGIAGTNGGPTYWYKYIRNGKILYVPNKPLLMNLTGTTILNGAPSSADGLTMTLKGNKYKVRLPKGWNDDKSVALPVAGFSSDMDTLGYTNEFNDLMYPLFNFTPLGQRLPTLLNQAYSNLGLNSYPQIIIAELNVDGSQTLTRGLNSNGRNALSAVRSMTKNNNMMFWPVLELIEG